MIRIFIMAVLYLISLLTQAQESSDQENQLITGPSFTTEVETRLMISCKDAAYLGSHRFGPAKFEVSDKDITFEMIF